MKMICVMMVCLEWLIGSAQDTEQKLAGLREAPNYESVVPDDSYELVRVPKKKSKGISEGSSYAEVFKSRKRVMFSQLKGGRISGVNHGIEIGIQTTQKRQTQNTLV